MIQSVGIQVNQDLSGDLDMNDKTKRKAQWDRLPKPSRVILGRKRFRDQKKPVSIPSPLSRLLDTLSLRNLKIVAKNHGIILSHNRKKLVIEKICEFLTNQDNLVLIFQNCPPPEKQLIREILNAGGCLRYPDIISRFGSEEKDSPYWFLMLPESTLGQLRAKGLVFVGEAFYDSWLQVIVCLASDVSTLLNDTTIKTFLFQTD